MIKKTIPIFLSLLILCACSAPAADSNDSNSAPGSGSTAQSRTAIQSGSDDTKAGSDIYYIGDCVLYPESDALLECTIVSAELFDNAKAAGLSSDEIAYIASQSLYATSITNPFLLIQLKIKDAEAIDVDYTVDYHGINMLQLLTKDSLDDPWADYLPEMVYYREHSETKASDYFHYTIEPGEEKTFTVGFLLTDDMDADSGLVIHVGGDTSLPTFVDLQIP